MENPIFTPEDYKMLLQMLNVCSFQGSELEKVLQLKTKLQEAVKPPTPNLPQGKKSS